MILICQSSGSNCCLEKQANNSRRNYDIMDGVTQGNIAQSCQHVAPSVNSLV